VVIVFLTGIARKLASSGYGVFAMDYPGFGLSEGLHCYIPSFDGLVDDVIEQYSKIKGKAELFHVIFVETFCNNLNNDVLFSFILSCIERI
jgi:alpha-beta hydrolase superfamily lysophospholipase